jgi:hypothetical protein
MPRLQMPLMARKIARRTRNDPSVDGSGPGIDSVDPRARGFLTGTRSRDGGTTKAPQLKDLVGAVDLKLTAEEVKALEAPYEPHRILGHAQANTQSHIGGGVMPT